MLTEAQLERQCLTWFQETGWDAVFGPDIAHDGTRAERGNYGEVVLVGRLAQALARLNPSIPAKGAEDGRATYGKEVVPGCRKAGVVWHTQGSGKSIAMVCYAAKLVEQPEMKNPTIVVVTDRNDLDGQHFETFSAVHELLKQTPEQADIDRNEELGLNADEVAFYDALAERPEVLKTMGERPSRSWPPS